MNALNKDIKSLHDDLLKNYKKRDIITMAQYHDLNLHENKSRLAMNVAKANYISTKKANMDAADVRKKTVNNVHEENSRILKKLFSGLSEIRDFEESLYNNLNKKMDYLPENFPLPEYSLTDLLKCFHPNYVKYRRLAEDLDNLRKPINIKLDVSPPPSRKQTAVPKMPVFPNIPKTKPFPEVSESDIASPEESPEVPIQQSPESDIASPMESPIFPDVPNHPVESPERPKYFEESPPPSRQSVPGVPSKKPFNKKPKPLPKKKVDKEEPLFPTKGESLKCQTDEECQQKADLGLLGECKGQNVICVTKRDGSKACVYEPTN